MKSLRPAIFLDRDGTISPDQFGYIKDPAGYHLYPETGEALRILKELGYLLFIITNQSGIARGYFGLDELQKVHDKMTDLILREGVEIDSVYFSPYLAEGIVAPYNVAHEDRKPGIGMYKRALKEHPFDVSASFMIGDRESDILFAKNAGLKSILLLTGNGQQEFQKITQGEAARPDFVCENILTAACLIRGFFTV